jgi:hypothetical protein
MKNTFGLNYYFECECSSNEHLFKITFDAEDKVAYIHTQLNNDLWYQRLLNAIKYIFGYKCRYGHWEETILGIEKLTELKNIIDKFEQETK